MQASAGGLDMIFQHLASLVGIVLIFHRFCPDTPCHTADHTILNVHSIAEEERKIGCKIINIHSAAQVILYISKSVSQGKCKLSNGVSTCFCNMITTDRYTVKI